MILAFVIVVWAGLFANLALFQIYRKAGSKPRPRWLTALELPDDIITGSSWQLLVISAAGLFIELLMIRWVSSEITIFAYFKNFVLIACFLGFGLGAYLSRQKINLLALLGPLAYCAVLIKLPWPTLRTLVQRLTLLLGATTEVEVWGVPKLPMNMETIGGLACMLAVVIPLFSMLALVFIPVGQATARMMENARDGILGYSINIVGSLVGVLLYTALCLLYQPPPVWFLFAGVMLLAAFWKAQAVRWAIIAVIGLCVALTAIPESNSYVSQVTENFETTGGSTIWSPYQKLNYAETRDNGELLAYQLMTNDNWYQYTVNLSDSFILGHQKVFQNVKPEWNAYNMPYHFYRNPPSVLVLGSGMGNDVAAALRNGAGRVTAVEIDPAILKLGKRLHFEHPYADPRVTVVNNDARSYIQNSHDHFDLISFSLLDSHTTSSHYSNIRIDNYVYTREALVAAKKLLNPDGVMVMKFAAKPFIAGRLRSTVQDVFGTEPVAFGVDQSFNVSPGTFFIAGSKERIAAAVQEPGLAHHIATHSDIAMEPAPITTDDWPFFYQQAPGVPTSVILMSIVLVVVCWQLMRRTAVPLSEVAWPFFFLGAGFMLLESQIVSRMALLFGTTWVVNSITISGLLALIVAANLLERAGLRLPTPFAYLGLFAAILIAYVVPVSALLSESFSIKLAGAILVLCSPVFFASILFIRMFAAARFSGSALGSNLLGSLVGGMLESLSMWIGLRSLLFIALFLYVAAYAFSLRREATVAAPEAQPVSL